MYLFEEIVEAVGGVKHDVDLISILNNFKFEKGNGDI